MNPGELRHRIVIQKLENTQDSFGQPVEKWNDVATVWSSVKPLVGREFFAAETVNSEVTHKVRMRYKAGITPDMRVKFGIRIFQITAVINYQERNIELQLMCKELV
jgi:SPP1 family predicted phage head-tail adaptor